jgi:hypothetical protein
MPRIEHPRIVSSQIRDPRVGQPAVRSITPGRIQLAAFRKCLYGVLDLSDLLRERAIEAPLL